MKFYEEGLKVDIDTNAPPEEIITSLGGTCGLWQICICVVGCVAFLLCGINMNTLRHSLLPSNYTCSEGNGTQCVDIKGSACRNFTFFDRPHGAVTFVEKLSLVCEKEHFIFWIQFSSLIGEVIGPFLVGIVANNHGIRASSVVFIPLQCLTGLLLINVTNVYILVSFLVVHSLFASTMCMYTLIAVCDSTGNKLRTFTLGILMISYYISDAVFPYMSHMFPNIASVLLLSSVLPLTLLIPLLYYKDSPNNICFIPDFSKAEEVLRSIAKINKQPMPVEAKLRPVQLILDSKQPHRCTFIGTWKPAKIRRAFLSLLCLNFFLNYYVYIFSYIKQKIIEHRRMRKLLDTIATMIALAVIHYIPHKVFIGITTFTKGACIGIVFAHLLYWKNPKTLSLEVLFYVCGMSRAMCHLALQNLAVRMYPTERRTIHLGFYWSVGSVGELLSYVIHFYLMETKWAIFFVLLVSPIAETLSCFSLWDVHNRELPDFLVDCIQFENVYKPTRYYCIYDVSSECEIEVKTVDLDKNNKNSKHRNIGRVSSYKISN